MTNRQTTTPFHLKLFYRQNTYHPLSDFSSTPTPNLPSHHLQIYTWQTCTLRELAHLLTSTLPTILPDPAIGTRLSFRLIYPDTKGAAMNLSSGRYLSKEMGSVVIAPRGYDESSDDNANHNGGQEGEGAPKSAAGAGPFRMSGADADKTLQDFRFVIGDYVDCAVCVPLEDGSVAPVPAVSGGARDGGGGGGMRAFPSGRGERVPDGHGHGHGHGRRENGGRERERERDRDGRRGWMPY
ncbi:SAP18 family protein [Aspergillus homomorphus CBS 101889]|uniref:Sin3-associated polypeptide Sap18 n=1 Tax=Aspergillus homomorphus (strain CBS 101889) TaxID=1450537 RepID=A0A395I9S9_ASPHC|nr:hypothetical protein BO97DRAFT_467497 [Aspergillus homomorphus CBS 101889]RAL16982.1 hypothetical protein BO97DRAFT_467497 [Aspergillus homomorphus CBS 101889]